jgi:hypothetical protein
MSHRLMLVFAATAICLGLCRSAEAYSVLAHEALVDALWEKTITPLLRERFPQITADEIAAARAYAYGGSVVQDLGYYPFGSKLFTNLTHYVRSGDFVEALLHDARSPDEYAFALGALAHYASDNTGHPLGVNRAVPLTYPKVRAKFGDNALYVDSPARHVMVEFAFDVMQVGSGSYTAQAYRDFIGFEVAKPLLERAFRETYGLDLGNLFVNEDLAIGTYRRAVSTIIPEMTHLAWEDKQDEIRKRTPDIDVTRFTFSFTRADYEKAYGTSYRKAGFLSRMFFTLLKLLPKIGPFRPLAFKPLTPDAARLMESSFAAARDRYRALLDAIDRRSGTASTQQEVTNTDFDTGKPPARAYNALLEETYAQLLDRLAKKRFEGAPSSLRNDLLRHYATPIAGRAALTRKQHKQDEKARRQLQSW